jgi:hypothetical protein
MDAIIEDIGANPLVPQPTWFAFNNQTQNKL